MNQLIISAMLAAAAGTASAQEVANCREPKGHVFFHFSGMVPKANAGWGEDKISGGAFTLTRSGNTLDILFVDARSKPISSTQDGAKVVLLRHSLTSASVLVHYPNGPTTEMYSFFREKDGRHRFSLLASKTGDDALAPKSALMVGDCGAINFAALSG